MSDSSQGNVVAAFLRPLGDAVRTVPELRYLARVTGSKVNLIVKAGWQRDLYAGLDYIGDVLSLDKWRVPLWFSPAQRAVVARLKSVSPRLGFVLSRRAKFAKLSRLLRRAGVPDDGIVDDIPGWRAANPKFPDYRPDRRDLAPPALHVEPDEQTAMRARLERDCGWSGGPLVVLHPGCGAMKRSGGLGREGGKNWSWQNWVALAATLREATPESLLVFTGSGDERELTERICKDASGNGARLVSLAGQTTMRELLALQSLASSGIATNTGASHTAMAMGCPLVSIFGNHDPRIFTASSFGWGACHTVRGADMAAGSVAKEDSPVNRIKPATVFAAWREIPPRTSHPGDKPYVRHYLEGGGVEEAAFAEEKRWGLE
ncbi:MAG: glycosyltransferase family 9 protein [Planctomycetaceae bacterium]|nr:glycosyltransferase family 9 protein [Planctomycetaceae bacterium]